MSSQLVVIVDFFLISGENIQPKNMKEEDYG
jgi:hypothetical protein